jgi:mannosyltransferase OCH1-like enzyme
MQIVPKNRFLLQNKWVRSKLLGMMNQFQKIRMLQYAKRKKMMEQTIQQLVKISPSPSESPVSVIPLNIFQTWCTKTMPLRMLRNILSIKNSNPEFHFYFFDDADCETFIEKHFPTEVLYSFRALIPGAYKADLWRYCVLYKLGGIYMDIKYHPLRPFRLIQLTQQEHWVLDADNNGVYNAVMVCKPGNPILLKAIAQIVANVKNRYYGNNCLEPTGPSLLSKYFTDGEKKHFRLKHKVISNNNNRYILWNNVPIMRSYRGYLEDCKNSKTEHYGILWNKRSIYK